MGLKKKLGNGLRKIGNFMGSLTDIQVIAIGCAIIGAYFLGLGVFIIMGG